MTVTLEPLTVVNPLRVDEAGTVRVGATRVTLDTVVHAWQNGRTPEGIVESYSTLSLGDVYAVVAYYLQHKEAVDRYLLERELRAQEVRQGAENFYAPGGLRERLLARQKARQAEPGK